MAGTDRIQLGFHVEPEIGKPHPNAILELMPSNSFEADHIRNFQESSEMRGDGFDTPDDFTSEDGQITFERFFKRRAFDKQLESLFWSRWQVLAERANALNDETLITDVAAATRTYTVLDRRTGDSAATLAAFDPSDLVYATGYAEPANNGLKTCAATTDAVAVVVNEALADETPPSRAELFRVGSHFPTDDLSIVGFEILSTANFDFPGRGFLPGKWIRIGGPAPANRFDGKWVNEVVKIKESEAGRLLVENTLANSEFGGWQDDAGAGKSIYLFLFEELKPAFLAQSLFWSRKDPMASTALITNFYGCHFTEATLRATSRDRFLLQATFMPLAVDDTKSVDIFSAAVRQRVGPTMTAGLNGQRMFYDGVCRTDEVGVRESGLTIGSGALPLPARGYQTYRKMDKSKMTARWSKQVDFDGLYLYDKYRERKTYGFADIMADDIGAYIQEAPAIQITNFPKPVSGPDQTVVANVEAKATADDALIEAGARVPFFAIHRCRYCGPLDTLLLPDAPTIA